MIKNVAKSSNSSDCILHKCGLVPKIISVSLKIVLEEAVQIINFIKTRPLQSRIYFEVLSENSGSTYSNKSSFAYGSQVAVIVWCYISVIISANNE